LEAEWKARLEAADSAYKEAKKAAKSIYEQALVDAEIAYDEAKDEAQAEKQSVYDEVEAEKESYAQAGAFLDDVLSGGTFIQDTLQSIFNSSSFQDVINGGNPGEFEANLGVIISTAESLIALKPDNLTPEQEEEWLAAETTVKVALASLGTIAEKPLA